MNKYKRYTVGNYRLFDELEKFVIKVYNYKQQNNIHCNSILVDENFFDMGFAQNLEKIANFLGDSYFTIDICEFDMNKIMIRTKRNFDEYAKKLILDKTKRIIIKDTIEV